MKNSQKIIRTSIIGIVAKVLLVMIATTVQVGTLGSTLIRTQ